MIRSKNYKVKSPFNYVAMSGHVRNKNLYISTSAGPMTTKLDGMMAYDEVSTCNGHMTQESLEEQNRLISISTRPIPIKLDKVVYYGNEPPRTKSHDTLIT